MTRVNAPAIVFVTFIAVMLAVIAVTADSAVNLIWPSQPTTVQMTTCQLDRTTQPASPAALDRPSRGEISA